MSTAHEKVEALRIPGSINRVEGMLLQIRQQFPNDGVERLDRFSKTLEIVKHRLDTANSQNTAVSIFQNIASALEAARNDLQRFVEGDPNAVNWDRLDENTDLLLRSLPDMGTAFEIGNAAIEKIKSVDAASRAALAEITEARSKVGHAFDDLRRDGGELLKRLEDLEIQGKSLSEIAASSVLRGDFAARAEAEKSAARLWTVSTWASAGLTIALLVYVFISHLLGVVSGATTDLLFWAHKRCSL